MLKSRGCLFVRNKHIILSSSYIYSCGLSTATIEYSPMCVCVSVCVSVNMITQKIMS